jgi:hypothetical protein
VGIGDWSQSANSPIKGHRRAPIKDSIRHLYRFGVEIRVLQEYCTSKMCHQCYFKSINPKAEILYKFYPDEPNETDDYKYEIEELKKTSRIPRLIDGKVYKATKYQNRCKHQNR